MIRINPGFFRFPDEAAAIGHLLSSFGELEVMICSNAAKATGLGNAVWSALYRIRSTRSRLDAADALMRPIYSNSGLDAAYGDAIGRVMYCLRIRNQFAHCNWGDHQDGGLFFVDLQHSAMTANFQFHWKHVDVGLLETHEEYFVNALEALRFMDHELAVKHGRLQSHFWPAPKALELPPLHNPEARHIPPWLSEEEKALHVARAQAAQGGSPTPTPAQRAQEKRRAEKLAVRQAHRDASKRSTPEPEK